MGTWGRRLLVALACAGPGCDEPVVEPDLRGHIEALCDEYCPLRIVCVKDGWADGSVKECIRKCTDERLYERGGEPSAVLIGQLECLASLSCEELPSAVEGGDREAQVCAVAPFDFDSAALVEE